jgi:hypothetical protein
MTTCPTTVEETSGNRFIDWLKKLGISVYLIFFLIVGIIAKKKLFNSNLLVPNVVFLIIMSLLLSFLYLMDSYVFSNVILGLGVGFGAYLGFGSITSD